MNLTVHGVIVPPLQPGIAFAHSSDGKCICFSGERMKMIELCERVKLHGSGGRGEVTVDTDEWRDVVPLEPGACPLHSC